MDVVRSLAAIVDAPNAGQESVRRAAKGVVEPGSLDISEAGREAYGRDLAAAREAVDAITTLDVSPPDELVLLDRHQWLDAAIDRQRAVYDHETSAEDGFAETLPDQIRTVVDAGRYSVRWSTAAGHAVGRYEYAAVSAKATDPDGTVAVVHPNVDRVSQRVDVDAARLRRWIVCTQVAFATTLGTVSWLPGYVRSNLLSRRHEDGDDYSSRVRWYRPLLLLDGYVHYLVSRMVDDEDTLRRSFHRDRWNRDVPTRIQRLAATATYDGPLHEIGRTFFEAVGGARGPDAVDAVWEDQETLPTWEELGGVPTKRWWHRVADGTGDVDCSPEQWLDRVDP